MYSTPAGPHRSLLDCVDKQEHSEKRKRLAAAFSTKHLQDWQHKIVDKCNRLITQFDRHCISQVDSKNVSGGRMIDFRKWSNLFTIEAIADIALSDHLGLLEAGDDTVVALDDKGNSRQVQFIKSLHGIGRMAAPIVWSSSGYRVLKRFCSIFSTSYAKELENNSSFDDVVRQMTMCRLQKYKSGQKLDDFFTCLVEDKQGQATNLAIGEIVAEVSVFSKSPRPYRKLVTVWF
jgi:cytochrome P450